MNKILNIVYDAFGPPEIYYQGPEGTVWYSNHRNENAYNVYISECINPNQNDSYIITEPIVTDPEQYNIEKLSKFRKIFGCFNKVFANTPISEKYVQINYGTQIIPKDADLLKNNWLSWEQRKPGVVIIAASNKTSSHHASIYCLREMLADFLFKNNINVAWYGHSYFNKPYYKGSLKNEEDKINKINEYRFTICTENTYSPIYSYNYLTEKLPHAIYGGAVPMYMGCYNIDELAPKDTFFDLRKFVIQKNGRLELLKQPLLNSINSFTKNDFIKYQEAAYNFIKSPTGICYHADMKRFFRQILKEYYP